MNLPAALSIAIRRPSPAGFCWDTNNLSIHPGASFKRIDPECIDEFEARQIRSSLRRVRRPRFRDPWRSGRSLDGLLRRVRHRTGARPAGPRRASGAGHTTDRGATQTSAPLTMLPPATRDVNPDHRTPILVVEDEPITREILVRYLERTGFVTHSCSTGEEALSILRPDGAGIDWLLTDINLPGCIDGWVVGAEFHLMYPR